MTTPLTHVFLPFTNVVKTADGARIVTGAMTSETLDLDEQITDYGWMKTAAQDWFQWANIREQHSSKAIGKGVDLQFDDAAKVVTLTSKVVDRDAIVKIDEGILQGYSWGAKGARVVKDAAAPKGRIMDGKLVEVSLVDHPANPDCRVTVAKSSRRGNPMLVKGVVAPIEEQEFAAGEERVAKLEKLASVGDHVKAYKVGAEIEADVEKGRVFYSNEHRTRIEQAFRNLQALLQNAQQGSSEVDTSDADQEATHLGDKGPSDHIPGDGILDPDPETTRDGDQRVVEVTPLQALAAAAQQVPQPALSADSTGTVGVPFGPLELQRDPQNRNPNGKAAKAEKRKAAKAAKKAAWEALSDEEKAARKAARAEEKAAIAEKIAKRKAARAERRERELQKVAEIVLAAITKNTKATKTKSAESDEDGKAISKAARAAGSELIKGLQTRLEDKFATKYAAADEVKTLTEAVDALGRRAQPGGPFVGTAGTTEKTIALNESVERRVDKDVLDRMQRLDALTKSDNHELARSAKNELKKLAADYFGEQQPA